MYLKTLNGCIKSTTCPRPVSLNCFSGAEKQNLKTTREKQLKDADCKRQSYIYIYIYIYDIYVIYIMYNIYIYVCMYVYNIYLYTCTY